MLCIANTHRIVLQSRSLVHKTTSRRGSRGGEMGEFSPLPPPLLFLSPLLFFSYPLNIEVIFDFSDIITKIHLPF